MEDYRSKSHRDGRMQIETYYGRNPNSMQDLRSYSANYSASAPPTQTQMKKSNLGSTSRNWSLKDPELQRKRRVASYKVYSVEGKVKGSFRKSFRWIKDTCNHVVYGWW